MRLMREFKDTAAVLAWVVFLPAVAYAQASVAGTVTRIHLGCGRFQA